MKHVWHGLPANATHEDQAVAAELPADGAAAVARQPLAVEVTEYDGVAGIRRSHRLWPENLVSAAHTIAAWTDESSYRLLNKFGWLS